MAVKWFLLFTSSLTVLSRRTYPTYYKLLFVALVKIEMCGGRILVLVL